MPTEAVSITKITPTTSDESRTKRQCAENSGTGTSQVTAMTPVNKRSPLEAALASVGTYVVTLDEDLLTFP